LSPFTLRHVIYRLAEEYGLLGGPPPAEWSALWGELNRHIQILEIIQYWMEYLMDHLMEGKGGPNDWHTKTADEVWGDLRWYLEEFLHSASHPLPATADALPEFHRCLGEKARDVCANGRGNANFNVAFHGLLETTDEGELALFDVEQLQTFGDEYNHFVALDALVYPLKFVSDLNGTELIKTLRVSPLDARKGLSNRRPEGKLAGATLAHFGGFFKRSWRSNDILWGRLDAISELIEATVTPERLQEIVSKPHLLGNVQARFQNVASVREIFPHSSDASADRIVTCILSALNLGANEPLERFKEMTKLLTEDLAQMAHLEVLFEDLPSVIADAAFEQAQWNRFRVPRKDVGIFSDDEILKKAEALPWPYHVNRANELQHCQRLAEWTRQDAYRMDALWRRVGPSEARLAWWDDRPPNDYRTNGQSIIDEAITQSYRELARKKPSESFIPARGFVDPQIATIAADAYARSSVAQWTENPPAKTPMESRAAVFFTRDYRVGSENLVTGMPPLVLVRILTHSLLVLRNCILGVLDERKRRTITQTFLFRFGLDWPLRTVHWMVRLWGREPVLFSIFQGIAFAVSVNTLILTLMGWDSLVWNDSGLIVSHLLLLVGLPAVVLLAQLKMAWDKPYFRSGVIAAIIIAFGAAAWQWDWITQTLHRSTLMHAFAAGVEAFRQAL
jgi:hypothetical protein